MKENLAKPFRNTDMNIEMKEIREEKDRINSEQKIKNDVDDVVEALDFILDGKDNKYRDKVLRAVFFNRFGYRVSGKEHSKTVSSPPDVYKIIEDLGLEKDVKEEVFKIITE